MSVVLFSEAGQPDVEGAGGRGIVFLHGKGAVENLTEGFFELVGGELDLLGSIGLNHDGNTGYGGVRADLERGVNIDGAQRDGGE